MESLHTGSWREGRRWGGGQMPRGSWEPCQQLGPPESLTKPTNPSRAGQGEGPEPLIPPCDPKRSKRGHKGIRWSKLVWWVGTERSGRGRQGGEFAWIGPWELSQPGQGRSVALAFSRSCQASRLPDCWRVEPSPLPKEPLRGAGSGGKATRGLVRLEHKLLPQLPGKNLITN